MAVSADHPSLAINWFQSAQIVSVDDYKSWTYCTGVCNTLVSSYTLEYNIGFPCFMQIVKYTVLKSSYVVELNADCLIKLGAV